MVGHECGKIEPDSFFMTHEDSILVGMNGLVLQ